MGTKHKDDFEPYWQDEKDWLCIVEFLPPTIQRLGSLPLTSSGTWSAMQILEGGSPESVPSRPDNKSYPVRAVHFHRLLVALCGPIWIGVGS